MTRNLSVGRPLRRDAVENRQKLVDAAMIVFAEHGLEGSVEEVARLAGVGMGTLYRRFPTKQTLVDEVVGGVRRALLGAARQAALEPVGMGLEELLRRSGQLLAERCCLQRIWDHSDADLDAMAEFDEILAELLTQAQRLGRMRTDATATDIRLVLWSVGAMLGRTRLAAPTAWQRHLELLIAGLRPSDLSLTAAPVTTAEVRLVTGGHR